MKLCNRQYKNQTRLQTCQLIFRKTINRVFMPLKPSFLLRKTGSAAGLAARRALRAVREADNMNFLSTHGVPNRFSAAGVLTSIGRESMRNIIDDNEKNNASFAKYSYEKIETSFRICVIERPLGVL